jgi:hypothetical protein
MRPSLRTPLFHSLVLGAVLASAAHATIGPEAQQVLDRYVKVVGAKPETERTLHQRSTLMAFGLTGRTESWIVLPDLHASDTELGPFKLREGYDGKVGWRTDPGGKLLILDGKDLEAAKASAWFESEGFLLPNQAGGTVTLLPVEKDSLGSWTVLEMTPPVGKPRRYYFDPKTGLLARVTAKNDQQSVVSRLTDYQSLGGRLRAKTTVTEIIGAPANTIKVVLDSVWVNQPIDAHLFEVPVEVAARPKYLKTDGVATLPFDYRGRHIWLKASVNGGPPADFIFDTGASLTVIDSGYAAKIGLATQGRQQGQGAGASGGASFAQLQTLKIASDEGDGVEFAGQKVAVLSINPSLGPFFWRDCAGVIGFDVINRFVSEVDFDKHVLTLREPRTFQYSGTGTAIPMTLDGHAPIVQMKIDGKYEGGFRVDLGSSSTVDLHTPFVKKHGLEAVGPKGIEVTGGGFGGTFTSRLTRLEKIELGPYSWTKPLVSMSRATVGAFSSEDYAGNIGNKILERFKTTFDYERRILYLEPGKLYGSIDTFSRSGVQLGRVGDVVRAMQVLAGSPAAKAGIREGDELVSLDGTALVTMTPDTVGEVLESGRVGSKHTLEIRRDGKVRKVTLTLKDII